MDLRELIIAGAVSNPASSSRTGWHWQTRQHLRGFDCREDSYVKVILDLAAAS